MRFNTFDSTEYFKIVNKNNLLFGQERIKNNY